MRKIRALVVLFGIILFVISCSQEEPTYDEITNAWDFLAVSKSAPSKIARYNLKSGVLVSQDIYQAANGKSLPGNIAKIYKDNNREKIYILMPESYQIEIISSKDFKTIASLDFKSSGLKPTDITCPNATDAYVAHSGTSKVTIVDTYYNKIARTIDIDSGSTSISSSPEGGNQVYCVNYFKNNISVLDTRTMKEETRLDVDFRPKLIGYTTNDEFVVIAEGMGKKPGTKEDSTEAKVAFVNPITRVKTGELMLGNSTLKAKNQIPLALAVTQRNYAFVITNEGLIRVDIKNKQSIRVVNTNKYIDILYDNFTKNIVLIRDMGGMSRVVVAEEISGNETYSADFSNEFMQIIPLH